MFELLICHLSQGVGSNDEAVRISDCFAAVYHCRQQEDGDFKVIRRRDEQTQIFVVDQTMSEYKEPIVEAVNNAQERLNSNLRKCLMTFVFSYHRSPFPIMNILLQHKTN